MTAKQIMDCRQQAAVALQKLIFRAHQHKGFVTPDDCMAVTDLITVSVIQSLSTYYSEEQDNELAN